MSKNITILSTDIVTDEATPSMLGVVLNLDESDYTHRLKIAFQHAIEQYFGVNDFNHDEIPNIYNGQDKWFLMVEIEGMNYEITLIDTKIL